ncbi:MAG TPA: DedA family protein [Blastocatellia bacterium]|jgi:membrane-associated protein|nr:DedA family protein [Blastocatellia bacterium]
MELVKSLIDFFLHLDTHLNEIIQGYGVWTYLILFLIVFCETGLVVTPFLPGDSLLFAAGTFAALGSLNITLLFIILCVAAIVGDTVNYWVGHYVGPKVFNKDDVRFLNRKHLERTHEFYEKYGGKTIIIARFIPIIRTFAPFVAGVGSMSYWRFIAYNVAGGVLWVAVCVFGGYFFGNLEIVKRNFSLVVVAIILISVLPIIIEFARHRFGSGKRTESDEASRNVKGDRPPADRVVD